jgi:hypothetical protein
MFYGLHNRLNIPERRASLRHMQNVKGKATSELMITFLIVGATQSERVQGIGICFH